MARIMLLEFKETTRHVKGSVSITYHDRGAPQELTAVFPNTGRETYSNGILQISKLFLNKLSLLLIIDCFYHDLKFARNSIWISFQPIIVVFFTIIPL